MANKSKDFPHVPPTPTDFPPHTSSRRTLTWPNGLKTAKSFTEFRQADKNHHFVVFLGGTFGGGLSHTEPSVDQCLNV